MAFEKIPDEVIEEINEKTDIVGLVSEYVKLTKSGADYKGLCPFHNEKTPSFMVSPSKNIAMCMGCHQGGRPITFLMKVKNIGFQDAVLELANRAGIEVNISKPVEKGPDYSRYYKIMDLARDFYSHNLSHTEDGKEALDYLYKRGIDDQAIEKFHIGLAPKKYDLLYQVLKKADISEVDMLEVGVIKNGDKGFYDLFQNRIMFPITDEQGHVVAFSGRIFNNNDTNQAKYINSPETVIFKKSKTLYHLSDAINTIRRSNRIILHEGQMDVIASVKAGFDEAVCSLGTALTESHAHILKKYANNIIVCYDGDNAGVNAMDKAIPLLKRAGFSVKGCILPNGMDPDEFVKAKGPKAFKDYLEFHQLSEIDFYYEYAIRDKNFSEISDIEAAKNQIFNSLKQERSQVLVESILKRFSDLVKISYASLIIDYNNYVNGNKPRRNEQVLPDSYFSQEMPPYLEEVPNQISQENLFHSKAELRIFQYAQYSKDRAKAIDTASKNGYAFLDCLETLNQKLWMKLIDEYYEEYDTFNSGIFLKYLNKDETNTYLHNVDQLNQMLHENYNETDMNDCINAILNAKVKSEALKMGNQIKDEPDVNLKWQKLQEKLNIIKNIDKEKVKKNKKGR